MDEGSTTKRIQTFQGVVIPEMIGWGEGRSWCVAEQKQWRWTWQQDVWQRPQDLDRHSWKHTNFQLWWGQSGVICTSDFMCPGLCGTLCFMCLACQVASDMNECFLCGTSVAMRTLYRTRYGIPVSLLRHCIIQVCAHVQNNCHKHGDNLMVPIIIRIWLVGVS